jgi:hypothetical protein
MLNSLRLLMFAGAMILGMYQYQQGPSPTPGPNPNPSPKPPVVTPDRLELIIGTETETFPSRPSEGLVEALRGLEEVVTNPDDALKLARAFKHWAKLVGSDTYITDLTKYQEVRVGSIRSLFTADPLSKSYAGLIDPRVKKCYELVLKPFYEGDKPPTKVTPEVRRALEDYNNAVSWKFSTIWLDTIKPVPLPPGPGWEIQ